LDKENGWEREIEELIVVEGKNDAHAVRRALGKVDVIWTEGFGLTEDKLQYISEMAKRRGVLICTDPDFVGRQIRERILKKIPEAKNVYLSRECATKNKDIGLENVSPEEIRQAFAKVLTTQGIRNNNEERDAVHLQDMVENGLVGAEGAAAKRGALGKLLGIGDVNAKQFLFRLNRFGIGREKFLQSLKEIEEKTNEI